MTKPFRLMVVVVSAFGFAAGISRAQTPDGGGPPEAAPTPGEAASLRRLAILDEARKADSIKPFTAEELGLTFERISARNAVMVTLVDSPQIQLEGTEVEFREGTLQVTEGAFDMSITSQLEGQATRRERNERFRTEPIPPQVIPNPLVTRSSVLEYEVGLRKKLATGAIIEPSVGFRRSQFKDVADFDNGFDGVLQFGVFIPLAQGGGTLVNLAPERAARFDLLASVYQLEFITSVSVRDTLRAYWECRAAEERYQLALESEGISSRLVDLSEALVEADEMAASELPQILADRATTTATRIQSERQLILSRQRLGIAMGYPPSRIALAPLTTDPFPEVRDSTYPPVTELFQIALLLRDDLRAAAELGKSRKVLMDAALLDLRPRVDLQFAATYLPFETRNNITTGRGAEYGVQGALSLDWPVANNVAIGELVQSTAAFDRTVIEEEDVERRVINGVIASLAELKGASAEVGRYADAMRLNAQALEVQEELVQLGQGSLTDAITSRQRLIDSKNLYINARERHAISLVELRFETATLIFQDEKGSWITAESWLNIPMAR